MDLSMGAYHDPEPLKIDCPICDVRSEHQVQIHVGASFEGGFRFDSCRFGDKLKWWPEIDPRYPRWRSQGEEGIVEYLDPDACDEWFDVTCPNCLEALRVAINFQSLYIVGLIDVVPTR
jgi:hypothetical protein